MKCCNVFPFFSHLAAAFSGSDLPIAAARKATVTFLWKKSTPTIEREIFLFSTFDQASARLDLHAVAKTLEE